MYDFDKNPHDFVFQLTGFGAALDDLRAQKRKIL
jgi:hypothetical protein